MSIFELRQYCVRPGKQREWLEFWDELLLPYMIAKGMKVPASFVSPVDESVYVWLRKFESEEERQRLYTAMYESGEWKDELSARALELLDPEHSKVFDLTPTQASELQ